MGLFYLNLAALSITTFLPQIRALSFFNYIWLFFCITWFFFVALKFPVFFKRNSIFNIFSFIFIFFVILISYLGGSEELGNRYLEFLQILLFIWSFDLISKERSYSSEKYFIFGILLVIALISINTVFAYIDSPNISRTAKKDTLIGIKQMASGIGGYEFIYMLVLLAVSFLYFANSKNRVSVKVVFLLITSLFFVNIILSNFSTALFILVFSSLIWFFLGNLKAKSFTFVIIVVLSLIPLLSYVAIYLMELFTQLNAHSMNASRINEVISFLQSGVAQDSIGARFNAFTISINTLYDYPLLGAMFNVEGDKMLEFIGQHSYLLDGFALFGFPLGLFNAMLLLYPLYKVTFGNKYLPAAYSFSVFFAFFIFIIVNNITPSVGFCVFFFMPLLMMRFYNEKN